MRKASQVKSVFDSSCHTISLKTNKNTTDQTSAFKEGFIKRYVKVDNGAVEQISKAFSRLSLQSSACQASFARCWVVALSTPRHCSSIAR